MSKPAWYSDVKKIFDSYNIPEYIWNPIMQNESGGNPKASNVTSKESSYGLFQINTKANPKYRGLDLTDPLVNAEIGARDFISGAYQKAIEKGITDPGQQTAYVWRYGIRPAWNETKEQKIITDTKKFMEGKGFSFPSLPDIINPSYYQDKILGSMEDFTTGAKVLGIYMLLGIVLVFFIFLLFIPSSLGEEVQKVIEGEV